MKKILIMVMVVTMVTSCKKEREMDDETKKMLITLDVVIKEKIDSAKNKEEREKGIKFFLMVVKSYIESGKRGFFEKNLVEL